MSGFSTSKDSNTVFGQQLKESQFGHHSPTAVRLNNGSFGACPTMVLSDVADLRAKWLSNPDDFWNYDLATGFLNSSDAIAKELFNDKSMGKEVAVVDNLTTAIAIITDSIVANVKEANSVIITSNMTYNAVRLAVKHGCALANDRTPNLDLSIVSVEIPFPISCDYGDSAAVNEAIIGSYREVFERVRAEDKKIVLAFLDHITSVPAILMPVRELIALCREYSTAEIVVDGAHAPGQVDLTAGGLLQLTGGPVGDRAADYYVANLHKWCFAPPTCAFLWVSPSAPSRHLLHHPIVSHRYDEVSLVSAPSGSMVAAPGGKLDGTVSEQAPIPIFAECAMLGTRDYAPMLAVPSCFRFVASLGGLDAIRERNSVLCAQAVRLLCAAWDTEQFAQHASLRTCSMAMVGCPAVFGSSWEASEKMRLALRDKYSIIIQKLYPVPGDRLYLRLSIAVYNSIEEFEALSTAVLEMLGDLQGSIG